jgi:endonuclease III
MVEVRRRVSQVVRLLALEYPAAECELDYRSPWELLVATVLSAQCTDARVNQVTPALFARWPGPVDLASASLEELECVIRPAGFFRTKARSLREAARIVAAEHGGEVPAEKKILTSLPGVGRKTANVVLGEAFGIPAGVAVDTHVGRLSRRLGFTTEEQPDRVADDLESLAPRSEWVALSKRLILHGRRVCFARRPRCESCCLEELCPKVGV